MLKHLGLGRVICGILILIAALCIAFAGFLFYLEQQLPNIQTLEDVQLQVPLRVMTADGLLIGEFGEMRRTPVTLDQIPKQLIDATLATEDQRFYSHSGIDILGLGRAAIVLITTGRKAQGGSTITMQVARNFFLTRQKTFTRKFKEILLAMKIDHQFSKDEILQLYLNKIFYGNRAYGVAAAAKVYYGKNLNQLTLPEMAMLAGLPQAPSRLNPLTNPQAALDRRNHVLQRMYDLGYIDQTTYQLAIAAPLTASYHNPKIMVRAPYVAEMVRDAMVSQYGNDAYTMGLTVYTTVNSKLQVDANNAVHDALLSYDQRHGYRGPEQHLPPSISKDHSDWLSVIKSIATVNTLQPAVVTNVSEQTASALLANGQSINIPWNNLSWARKQTMRNGKEYLGPRPTQASDILQAGDVIRVMQQKDHQWRLTQIPAAQAGLVALNPINGEIEALVGGFNFDKSGFNRITQAQRQPGSSFKPFLYSAALEQGFTLATLVNDAPIVTQDVSEVGEEWRPENDTKDFYGPIRLRVALMLSRNLASIRVLQSIGIPYAINYITRFGFSVNQLPNTLSLALGSATITPLQSATAYAVFANGGYRINPYFIDHVTNNKGQVILQTNPQVACESCMDGSNPPANLTNLAPRVITPQNAYLMNSALRDVIAHGTGTAALVLHRADLAGKTGTTNQQMDAWFCGFNSKLVAIAWVGFDQPQSLYEYGAQAALPMWIDFMGAALKGQPLAMLAEPPGIVSVRIDPNTGLLAKSNQPNAIFEIFEQNNVPTQISTGSSNGETTPPVEQLY